ncbi:hypothetical protein FIU87_21235 [Bacillus sp. THAF10]|nr:hypothetical protein FIU87_21235 [Bacillus sp. THAF10]
MRLLAVDCSKGGDSRGNEAIGRRPHRRSRGGSCIAPQDAEPFAKINSDVNMSDTNQIIPPFSL